MKTSNTIVQSLHKLEIIILLLLPVIVNAVVLIIVKDAISVLIFSIVTLPLIIALIGIMIARLVLVVEEDQIGYYIKPFTGRKNIARSEISRIELQKLRAIKDFGGWGIRRNYKTKATGYIFNGNHCIVVSLTNGKKIIFSIKDVATAKRVFTEANYYLISTG